MIQFRENVLRRRIRWALATGTLVAALLAGGLAAAPAADASTTFTVDNTADPGDGTCSANGLGCTLREAINAANATPGEDLIRFNIPNPGVQTIRPTSGLPEIVGAVTIDGYTQPGATPNTLATGTNAKPMIELDGTLAGSAADGLEIRDNLGDGKTVIRGLAINRFGGTGIFVFQASADSVRIEGNFVGTDASGTLDRGNGIDGVAISAGASDFFVGGSTPAARNLISGNASDGVDLRGVSGVRVEGNLIGTKKNGTGALGNDNNGVNVSLASDNFVGEFSAAGGASTIAFNGGDGVNVFNEGTVRNRIFSNSIFANGRLGIDLVGGTENAAGATANDSGDGDTGPNGLQNKPVLTSAKTSSAGTTIKGKLASSPNTFFTVQFFSNPSGDEGKKFIGQKSVTTDGSGNASFAFSAARKIATGQTITATASNNVTRDTSEFSAPRAVVAQ